MRFGRKSNQAIRPQGKKNTTAMNTRMADLPRRVASLVVHPTTVNRIANGIDEQ